MAKKRKQTDTGEVSGMQKSMEDMNSITLHDAQGNLVFMGDWVIKEPMSEDDADWYAAMNDPNAEIIVEDMGVASGELYDPHYTPGEPSETTADLGSKSLSSDNRSDDE